MSDIAIRVENLGKKYRIGERERYKALRDVITDAAAAPFRKLRNAFSSNGRGLNGSSLITHDASLVETASRFPLPAESNGNGNGSNGSSLVETASRFPLPASRDDTFWALRDVSFEVKRGEVVGIIGRNGAGKSTLLKILSRITAPTTGEVEIKGRVGSLLEVGTGFHPELTGRENIYLNGAILGMKRAEINRKFDEMVAFAEIEKFIDTPVKRYSSGMYVRLAFAVAAHLDPEILLVDEVLAVGDAQFQKKCLGKMGDVAKEGRTVLFVSHNMDAVARLCEKATLLTAGRVNYQGPTTVAIETYYREPQDRDRVLLAHPKGVIKHCQLIDQTGADTRCLRANSAAEIVIHYEAEHELDRGIFGIGITSMSGVRVCTMSTAFAPNYPRPLPWKGVMRCKIARVPFIPSTYTLRLAFDDQFNYERHEEVITFEVVGGCAAGAQIPSSVHGVVIVDSDWVSG